MCPACIATVTLLVAGSASSGGLTTLVAKKFRRKNDPKTMVGNPAGKSIMTTIETEHPSH
jgi:hypothetical protein